MRWDRRGLVWGPGGFAPWAAHSALQPTPHLFDGGPLRVYAGFRDAGGRGSVGFVDLDPADPSRVLGHSERPALAFADAGAFAVDGAVPTHVTEADGVLRLYYAGYVRRTDVRFQVFTGLAVSEDGGETFRAHSDEPVTPPSEEGTLFRVLHTVRRDGDRWRAWYGAGSEFRRGDTKTLPVYDVRHAESPDGIQFPAAGTVCIPVGHDEHRVGRPWVLPTSDRWEMYFGSSRSEREPYRLAYATSPDGLAWERDDDALDLPLADEGWDSRMMAYPAVVTSGAETYLFYNGNDYGREGFGYAVLRSR